ncbi:hypothetical protein DPMN_051690 [Dreissena polymorpha]|uniref:Uncharacterized protein n=1 Tax=Dreissena polymorpha TaxID=45954 RepID=A0A9D4CIA8_DREPO|nr:hypothetical protein DPMN_051690 [Dreissena polymorpha]
MVFYRTCLSHNNLQYYLPFTGYKNNVWHEVNGDEDFCGEDKDQFAFSVRARASDGRFVDTRHLLHQR